MWRYKPDDEAVIQQFFRGNDFGGMWKLLFKPKKNTFPSRDTNIVLIHANPMVKAEKMKSSALLLEGPGTPQLEKILSEDPCEVSVKTKEERKNRTKNLVIREGTSDSFTYSHWSSHSESDEEEGQKEEIEVHFSKGEKRWASKDFKEV